MPGLSRWFSGKECACWCRRLMFDPWVRKISWRRIWQPIPVCLPGKSHGQRYLVGYSPWSRKRVGYNLATKQLQCMQRLSWRGYCSVPTHKGGNVELPILSELCVMVKYQGWRELAEPYSWSPCRTRMTCSVWGPCNLISAGRKLDVFFQRFFSSCIWLFKQG